MDKKSEEAIEKLISATSVLRDRMFNVLNCTCESEEDHARGGCDRCFYLNDINLALDEARAYVARCHEEQRRRVLIKGQNDGPRYGFRRGKR